MSKVGIGILVNGQWAAFEKTIEPSLKEAIKRFGLTTATVEANELYHFKDLKTVLKEGWAPDKAHEAKVMGDWDKVVPPTSAPVVEAPKDKKVSPEWIRALLAKRLVDNTPELPGCDPHEVRILEVLAHWNTGLSRGAISRHMKTVIETLKEQGHTVEGHHGRFRLIKK